MPLKILQKDNAVVGTDIYRDDTASIPNAFRATLTHSINPNKVGTNNQVTVKSTYPVVVEVNGTKTSKDAFFCQLKFSSLQEITNDVERAAAFDNLIAYAVAAKQSILGGTLPDEPLVITVA